MIPLSEASELTGISRSGFLKAIRRGTLSASEANGQWLVDPSELSRVYSIRQKPVPGRGPDSTQTTVVDEDVRHLETLVEHLMDERNYLRQQLQDSASTINRLTAVITAPRPDGDLPKNSPRTPWLLGIIVVCAVLAVAVAVFFAVRGLA